jgi:hypothetical protein
MLVNTVFALFIVFKVIYLCDRIRVLTTFTFCLIAIKETYPS